jgi:hypothetical protein
MKSSFLQSSRSHTGLRRAWFHFPSPHDFVDACKDASVQFNARGWSGQLSSDEAYQYTLAGDDSRVEKCQALVDQFSNDCDLALSYPTWNPDVCGAYPLVPEFLAGLPECMMRRQMTDSDRAPVTLWVCVTSSGGIDAEECEARGIAIMALAMALSQTRAVNVRLFSGLDGPMRNHLVTVDLPQPFSLAQAAFILSSQSFSRGLTYKFLDNESGAGGGWPDDIHHGKYASRREDWKKLLPIGADDVVFPHIFMGDPDLVDPVGYCKGVFAEILKLD